MARLRAGPRGQQYAIEQASEGYPVLGNAILVWKETLREAFPRRAELESTA